MRVNSDTISISVPGRVNLIGEHTDYHEGFVLPVAIDLFVNVTGRLRKDRIIRIYSEACREEHRFFLDSNMGAPAGWKDMAEGIIRLVLEKINQIQGMDLRVSSNLPIGGGLSSSAAFLAGIGAITAKLFGLKLGIKKFARTLQKAEHRYGGVRCGIMDQMAILASRKNKALFLDCRTLETELIPIPSVWSVVILDTGIRHTLNDTQYHKRQQECREVLSILKRKRSGINSLRDITIDDLEKSECACDPVCIRRCRHVISENERVIDAVQALRDENRKVIGKLFSNSHKSLSEDYDVSCPELDLMVEKALEAPGCIAARMTGGGFGGCTVNIVDRNRVEEFIENSLQGYSEASGCRGNACVVHAVDGLARKFHQRFCCDDA